MIVKIHFITFCQPILINCYFGCIQVEKVNMNVDIKYKKTYSIAYESNIQHVEQTGLKEYTPHVKKKISYPQSTRWQTMGPYIWPSQAVFEGH